MVEKFQPNFNTPDADLCPEELNKLKAQLKGTLPEELDNEVADLSWESEQIAKSHGIYLEFNRAQTGRAKDWYYMIRLSIPGGGPITAKQWAVLDDIATKYTGGPFNDPSIRLTTRQNIQYHWIKKENVVDLVRTAAESGIFSLNGCGDNTRNVMACPLSRFSDSFNGVAWAAKAADYFRLPEEAFIKIFAIDPGYLRKPDEPETPSFAYGPKLLNRKFKIAFSAVQVDPASGKLVVDNCVEALTNDLAIVPLIENNKVSRFQIYIGGGQGEKNGKTTVATLAKPLTIVGEDKLLEVMDAVVKIHQDYGDRQNRHWARLKYVVKKMGTDWYRQQMETLLGYSLELPNQNLDVGCRHMHHGWGTQPDGNLYFCAYIENGRLNDQAQNGKLKAMVRFVTDKYQPNLMVTANQDLLFMNIPAKDKAAFQSDLESFGFGKRNDKVYSTLRLLSGACVGRDTCRLTYTDSEKFEPFLIDDLEKLGWGDSKESIGITGCERQCFRPGTKSVGLVGTGFDRYQFKLMGTEDGRHQGLPLYNADRTQAYLRNVPRDKVAVVIDALFKFHKDNKLDGEDFGYYNRRVGSEKIIEYLKSNPDTAALMEKPIPVKGEVLSE